MVQSSFMNKVVVGSNPVVVTFTINNVHKFPDICNAVCMHVTCVVETVDVICEGLDCCLLNAWVKKVSYL